MKKMLSTIIMCAMLSGLMGCNQVSNNTDARSLYAHGLEVVDLMWEMAQSEEYISVYTGNGQINEIIQNIGEGDYTEPELVYSISITDENLANMAELNSIDDASDDLKEYMMQRVLGALVSQINGMSGVENLAASSVCTVGKTFVNENATEDIIYLYTYENALPVAVTFIVGEDGSVSASGMFVMYDDFNYGSAEEIKNFFNDIEINVKEVVPEK